jgi:Lon protease-like protein
MTESGFIGCMPPDLTVPTEIPVMSLPHTVLFPNALLPLYIFEPRYRQMLAEAWAGNRIFGIATRIPVNDDSDEAEPIMPYLGVGWIKACHKNADGTSNILLQGFARAKVVSILREEPYRLLEVEEVCTQPFDSRDYALKRSHALELLDAFRKFGGEVPKTIMKFLEEQHDAQIFSDLAAYTFCQCLDARISMLGSSSVDERFAVLLESLKAQVSSRRLLYQLQGGLSDDLIQLN